MATAKNTNWDQWFDMQRKAMEEQAKNLSGLQAQWGSFFSEWQNLVSGNSKSPGADSFSAFFTKSGEGYLNLLEQFYKTSGHSKAPEDAFQEWISGMQKFFETALQTNGQPYDATNQYKNFMEGLANTGPSFWSSAFKNNPFSERWGHQPTGFLFDPFGFYASLPGLGYTREKQEHLNLLYRLWVDYEGATRRYNAEMIRTGLEALHKFQDYLKNPPETAPPLHSLRDVYSKWVDVCEELYAEYALSEEYTALYGEVVNALMAYKKQLHILSDDMAEQFNLPTRSEVDSLHARVHELRRENRELSKIIKGLYKNSDMKKENKPSKDSKKGKKK